MAAPAAASSPFVASLLAHDVMMLVVDPAGSSDVPSKRISPPVTLQPTLLQPSSMYRLAALQQLWNVVVDNVSRDLNFLSQTLGSSDEFASELLQLARRVYMKGPDYLELLPEADWPQRLQLGVFRNDYMRAVVASGEKGGSHEDHDASVHSTTTPLLPREDWKHVEINTISCSFAGLSTRVGLAHRDVSSAASTRVLVSDSEIEVPRGLALASHAWLAQRNARGEYAATGRVARRTAPPAAALEGPAASPFNPNPLVVFVVQEGERNYVDQRLLMIALKAHFGVDSKRMTLRELNDVLVLTPDFDDGNEDQEQATSRRTNAFLRSVQVEDHHAGTTSPLQSRYVSVFYFRSTYDANDFKPECAWHVREQIEKSTAVKCPSVLMHLCTMKRVQQALSKDAVLEKFVLPRRAAASASSSSDAVGEAAVNQRRAAKFVRFIQETVMGQFLLDDPSEKAQVAIRKAIEHSSAYVLKTQKEGYGRLYTGSDVPRLLQLPRRHAVSAEASQPLGERNEGHLTAVEAAGVEGHTYEWVASHLLLMERIVSMTISGSIWRQDAAHHYSDLALELGTFGVVLSDGVAPPDDTTEDAHSAPPSARLEAIMDEWSEMTRRPNNQKEEEGSRRPSGSADDRCFDMLVTPEAASAFLKKFTLGDTQSAMLMGHPSTSSTQVGVMVSAYAGFLARTKSLANEGGGVMSGVAALDTVAFAAPRGTPQRVT